MPPVSLADGKSTPRKRLDKALKLDETLNSPDVGRGVNTSGGGGGSGRGFGVGIQQSEGNGGKVYEPKPPRREEKRDYKNRVKEVANDLVEGVMMGLGVCDGGRK